MRRLFAAFQIDDEPHSNPGSAGELVLPQALGLASGANGGSKLLSGHDWLHIPERENMLTPSPLQAKISRSGNMTVKPASGAKNFPER
jgi:hypothetical protein